MKRAPVIAIVGPSGVGKDSVIDGLVGRYPGFYRIRRVITRPVGETGEDFERVSVDRFQRMITKGAFSLHWCAHGLYYGIPKDIDHHRAQSAAVLVNLSRSVLLQAQDAFKDLMVVSLITDENTLAQRLRERGREDAVAQARRLDRVAKPLPDGLERVMHIDNSGPLATTIDAILSALQAERGKFWIR